MPVMRRYGKLWQQGQLMETRPSPALLRQAIHELNLVPTVHILQAVENQKQARYDPVLSRLCKLHHAEMMMHFHALSISFNHFDAAYVASYDIIWQSR